MRASWILALLCLISISSRVDAWPKYRFNVELGGVKSVYTESLKAMLAEWPPGDLVPTKATSGPNPISLRCFQTPDADYFVGVEQVMHLNASRTAVETVLEAFENYASFFPGYEDIHLESRDENRFVTFWEQIIPLFFVPNLKYQMLYVADTWLAARHIYRYQLKSAISSLKSSDGTIVLENEGTGTRYVEYDFFEADTSLIPASRIWRESVQDIYLSDMGIKLKVEHPELDGKAIKKAAKEMLEKFPVDDCLNSKSIFYKFNIAPK